MVIPRAYAAWKDNEKLLSEDIIGNLLTGVSWLEKREWQELREMAKRKNGKQS